MNTIFRSILVGICLSMTIAFFPINDWVKAEESTVISRLMVREGTIIISQNSIGKIEYSLIDSEGNSLITNISEAQLVAQYPDLYNLIRSAIANPEIDPWAGMLDY